MSEPEKGREKLTEKETERGETFPGMEIQIKTDRDR